MSFYDYSVKDIYGNDVSMRDFEGKVVLVVNTATGCGFTPQYKELEEMYEKYHDAGFEIVDVPCNQFMNQASGTDEQIHEFCTLKYNTRFPQMKKADVNGENAAPLFTYLKSQKGFEGFSGKGSKMLALASKANGKSKEADDIKWNFTKFAIDREGNVVARFEPFHGMEVVDKCIAGLL